jgi:hypothetical protein
LPHAFDADGDVTPAMRLFEERAREVRPDFCIDDDNSAAVAELCRRLDALPLAIELAAARVRVLSPQAMVTRLDESLSLLSSGKRDLPERHQTLRATLEWSLDLLSPEERVFFRRLGIFAGSFSEDAATAVVDQVTLDTLDGLMSLVEKSLLVRSELRGEARFQMLETVREFAREQVAASGEERAARHRHGQWVAAFLAAEHNNLLRTQTRQGAHERIASEETGIRLALRFAGSADGDHELAWELFVQFGFALIASYARTVEVLATHDLMNELPRSSDPLRAARALGIWSWARASVFDPAADPDLDAACAVLEGAGDREFLMCFQTAWGMLLTAASLSRGLTILDRALMLAREAGQTAVENFALMTICFAQINAGVTDDAQERSDEFTLVAERRRDDEAMSYALVVAARVDLMRGEVGSARNLFAEAAALASAHSEAWALRIALCGLASATLASGDETGSQAILEEAIIVCLGGGYLGMDSLCGALALLLLKADERDRAARVFDAVAAGTEDATTFNATSTDPSGALRTATREARALLGDPAPRDPATVDLDDVLQAALGDGHHPKRSLPSFD